MGDTIYRFGAFELLARRQVLLHVGKPVQVGTRAFAILKLLVERAGELVAGEELVAAAWPTTIVEFSNLKVNMAHLRRVLTTCDPQQDYIATIPGRGYRFVSPVRRDVAPTITYRTALLSEPLPPVASLIGREEEVATVCKAVRESHFVTVVGAGGIGKTSVAVAAAHRSLAEFVDGVCFIDLAPLGDTRFLASVIAAGLGVRSDSEDQLGAAIHALQGQNKLLVLDSCEHLLPSIAAAAERLAEGLSDASLLITSREPLHLPRENVFRLEPLAVPPMDGIPGSVLSFGAVEMFVTRGAQASGRKFVDEDLTIAAEICRRLDGIPLAIALAASRTGAYSLGELLGLLSRRFDMLDQGNEKGPARHRTLRATLEWSYGLLSAYEAAVLRALSVYAGAFTIDDAIVVASAAGVQPTIGLECTASLISKSLLSAQWSGDVLRYRLLDSTRAFAADQLLEDPNRERIRRRYAEHICVLLERSQDEWQQPVTDHQALDHARGLDDVRRALAWAFESNGSVALGIRTTVAAIPMWESLSLLDESIVHLSRALKEGRDAGFDNAGSEVRLQIALATALMYAGGLAPETSAAWDRALELADAGGEPECRLRALWGRAVYDLHFGQPVESARRLRLFGELCRMLSDQSAAPDGERLLAAAEMYLGDFAAARERVERLSMVYLARGQRVRHRRFQVDRAAAIGTTRALLLWLTGHSEMAVRLVEETAREALASGHAVSVCNVLSLSACPIALWNGQLSEAERYLDVLQYQLKHARLALWARVNRCLFGALMIQREDADGIDVLEKAVNDLLVAGSATLAPAFLGVLAEGMARKRRIGDAQRTIERALSLEAAQQERWILPELLRVEAAIRVLHGQAHRAKKQLLGSIRLADEMGAVAWRHRASNDLSRLQRNAGRGSSIQSPPSMGANEG